jgi:acyl-CoA thioester hydrolase
MTPIHRHPLRVYFEDTDASGMAYHASYLRWAERARTESLRAMGLAHQRMIDGHNTILVVRRVEVEYWRPARLDDSVVVETAIARVTGAQVMVDQTVVRQEPEAPGGGEEERRLALLRVGLVCVDRDSLRPAPIPEPWRSAFRGLAAAAGPAPGEAGGPSRRRWRDRVG